MFRGTGLVPSVIHAAGSPSAGASARPNVLVVLMKMTLLRFAATACSSTVRVPATFVSTNSTRLCEPMCGLWSVAEWITASMPATLSRTKSGSAIEPTRLVNGESRMSSPTTSWPVLGSTRMSASPRCPELPVTSIRTNRELSDARDRPPPIVLPKAELHVHLEGTAPPELVQRIAARNGVAVPDGILGEDGRFRYTDFLDFLRTYDLAASVIRTGEDYRDIVYEYLCSCARGEAIYVELTASPDHAALVGLSDKEHLDGIARGIDDAR